jgi:hypothetical protein
MSARRQFPHAAQVVGQNQGRLGEGTELGNLVESLSREQCPPPGKSGAEVGRSRSVPKAQKRNPGGHKTFREHAPAVDSFGQLAEDIRAYSEKHYRDQGHIGSRLKRSFPISRIGWPTKSNPKTSMAGSQGIRRRGATANRYQALFSLIFREALRNGKVTGNPAQLVRLRHENNGRIRFLTDDEEKSLRKAITKEFPERLPELTISLGTG